MAGIAAAMRLLENDARPIIIETTKRLGGRASSVVDPRTGEVIDNCQHVVLGCCTNLLDLYAQLGVLDRIQWYDTLYWTKGGLEGSIDVMKAGRLPAPFHLSGSLRRLTIFSRQQKRHIARGMWRMIRLGPRGRLAWAGRTFAEFLRECGQPHALVREFWNTIIVSACNLDVDRVDALHALQVFQDGFLANRASYVMGLATLPLAKLYASAIDKVIEAGGDIQLGLSAKAIAFDGRRATGVVTEHGMIESVAVISAVPPDRLSKLASDTMKRADQRLQQLDAFTVSPILGVHLRFKHRIMDLPHLVLVGAPSGVQWLFNKSNDDAGQYIHAVISGADDWMSLDEDEIVRRVLRDVYHALPRAAGLQPLSARAIKEKRATFAAIPGVESIRPSAAAGYGGGIENLVLAGDWTDTGWPATMEGAVRSGYAAAGAIMGQDAAVLAPDLPPGPLARLLGLRG